MLERETTQQTPLGKVFSRFTKDVRKARQTPLGSVLPSALAVVLFTRGRPTDGESMSKRMTEGFIHELALARKRLVDDNCLTAFLPLRLRVNSVLSARRLEEDSAWHRDRMKL